jgi:ubiquinone biosynthesis accessory factor UbiJ
MLSTTLENALNRGLPLSPRAQALCRELAGRTLAIEVPEVTRVLVESTGDLLRVTRGEGPADAEVSGGPLGLLALSADDSPTVLQGRGVEIRGDAAIAERFRELGMLLRPDLEELLARLVGDVPAHQIGRFSRLALSWSRGAARTTLTNIAEYLAHERRDLVPRNEGEQFLRGVDALREDVDRLEARLDLLMRA